MLRTAPSPCKDGIYRAAKRYVSDALQRDGRAYLHEQPQPFGDAEAAIVATTCRC
jgi:hypothetical protein